ncbi:hypothetical protein BBX45_13600 [Proteus mirabilis]|uniref:hypothetical protein n=1 Tax=Morganellaceae TaxID=1903414 RepID=UPI0002833B01|nr:MULTISPECIES: hypothetical protein [Morganellaceae]EKA96176.1 hypothetical protein HMPREF1311_03314 [Proteus mirabilis WGLW6]ELA7949447.1 hypothetical protein [Proteus mirabilis]MBG3050112.1 hypothetical protein [Proteus mirabilis]MBG6020658.1 hypothetical protein [Proteus mirabilis]MBI6190166.1 hypothetical protein [Providencia rettgeri]
MAKRVTVNITSTKVQNYLDKQGSRSAAINKILEDTIPEESLDYQDEKDDNFTKIGSKELSNNLMHIYYKNKNRHDDKHGHTCEEELHIDLVRQVIKCRGNGYLSIPIEKKGEFINAKDEFNFLNMLKRHDLVHQLISERVKFRAKGNENTYKFFDFIIHLVNQVEIKIVEIKYNDEPYVKVFIEFSWDMIFVDIKNSSFRIYDYNSINYYRYSHYMTKFNNEGKPKFSLTQGKYGGYFIDFLGTEKPTSYFMSLVSKSRKEPILYIHTDNIKIKTKGMIRMDELNESVQNSVSR